ncbi:phosphoglycolate phosphatase [Bordetella genomosp. 10]|uniref:phosphoglycolate phosphatase n=1 Tax=Bordetella genomosp. 10 TaxID=1416804 RepID=A0A261SLZ3_9BORD|nr:HAD-IA family hydrolase [Bordetella genomosp. 10]OZI38434.1 phosphoglycolate phosphatase [Bordetella genomosp. 10]
MKALILFDFDGTLADTAPDLAAAANLQRTRRGLEPMPFEILRPVASQGARGLLRVALGMLPDHPEFEATRTQFLADYAASSTVHSQLFPGIAELLRDIEARGHAWGIVTNKVTYLAEPVVVHLGLAQSMAVLVCGDTVGRAKPYPDPLLHAAKTAGYTPDRCVYVGDDLRDVQAAHAAGMPAIAAAYGYLGGDEDVTLWEADAMADHPRELWAAIAGVLPGVAN